MTYLLNRRNLPGLKPIEVYYHTCPPPLLPIASRVLNHVHRGEENHKLRSAWLATTFSGRGRHSAQSRDVVNNVCSPASSEGKDAGVHSHM